MGIAQHSSLLKGPAEMDYAQVLKRAWQITWKVKALWIFGILAGCGSGGGGGGSTGYRTQGAFGPQVEAFLQQIPEETWIAIAVGLLCLMLFMILVTWVLGAVGLGGLIGGVNAADQDAGVTIGDLFSLAMTYFWKLLIIQIMAAIVVLAIIVVFGAFALVAALVTFGLALLPIIGLLIMLGVAIEIYLTLTQVALVVEDLRIAEAFERGWLIIRRQPGPIVIMSLLLLIGGGIARLFLSLPLAAVIFPILAGLMLGTDFALQGGFALAAVCVAIYLPFLILFNGILETFLTGSWTITYRRLTGASPAHTPSA
jgi:hypothetical protein